MGDPRDDIIIEVMMITLLSRLMRLIEEEIENNPKISIR